MTLSIGDIFHIAETIAVVCLLSVPYGAAQRRIRSDTLRNLGLGVVFGLVAAGSMLDPIVLSSGVIFDLRALPIGIAGGFLGPLGGVVAALIAAAMRMWIGGAGALPALLSITIAVTMGILAHYLIRPRPRWPLLLKTSVLGVMVSTSSVAVLLLPAEVLPTALPMLPVAVPLTIIGCAVAGTLLGRELRVVRHERALDRESVTDPLTGLSNRRGFERRVAASQGFPGADCGNALLLLDIDHFKRINDTHGHSTGDTVLSLVGARLRHCLRARDVSARFGGEEFAIYLPATSRESAADVAERLRQSICSRPFRVGNDAIAVSVSIGASWSHGPVDREIDYNRADRALYAAKQQGRNRVVFDDACALPSAQPLPKAASAG